MPKLPLPIVRQLEGHNIAPELYVEMWSDRCGIYFNIAAKSSQIYFPRHHGRDVVAAKKNIFENSKK